MSSTDPRDLPSTYLDCYADFKSRVDHQDLRQTEVFSFQQEWASTACGHGGIGGSAITPAQTYVFNVQGGKWYVYQGGRFSYSVENPNDKFIDDLREWKLVGESDYDGQYEF